MAWKYWSSLALALTSAASVAMAQTAPREIGPATQVLPHAVTGGFELPNGWRITPEWGALPYSDYEPMAFWGDRTKLDACRRRSADR